MVIRTPTVLILGAGASAHYGYPTGEALVRQCHQFARSLNEFLQALLARGRQTSILTTFLKACSDIGIEDGRPGKQLKDLTDLLERFSNRLEGANPTVIDYFLSKNPELADIGRFIIACCIVRKEVENDLHSFVSSIVQDRLGESAATIGQCEPSEHQRQDWIRFLLEAMTSDANNANDLLLNELTIITFNYDISLEKRLRIGLESLESIWDEKVANTLLSTEMILHIYGSIGGDFDPKQSRSGIWPGSGMSKLIKSPKFLDEVDPILAFLAEGIDISKSLVTIAPKHDRVAEIASRARRKILEAKKIYILGYGFDSQNNRHLGLDEWSSEIQRARSPTRRIFYTNLSDQNRINNKASRLFAGNIPIPSGAGHTLISINRNGQDINKVRIGEEAVRLEKSVKKVYAAIAEDFDALDED